MATPNLTAITTVTPALFASAQLAAGDNTIYTVGAAKAAKLAKLVLTNTSASAPVIVSVSVVPAGGTADTTHRVVSAYPLAPSDSIVVGEIEGVWLGAGAVVSVNAGTAALVDATLSGLEFA